MRDYREQPHPLAGRPGLPQNVRLTLAEAAMAEITAISAATRPHDPETPVLIAVLRDEAASVAAFLAHYRRLGVTRFALIDHGSTDATPRLLAAEPDVDLWSVARPFPGKQGWVNALIARYGHDRWYLHVDADERLVFDGFETAGADGRRLPDLIRFATARGLRRLRGMLVDMYAPGPCDTGPCDTGPCDTGPCETGHNDPACRCRLFDSDGYDEALLLGRISRKGGPRRRCFPGVDPELTKYPLFHIRIGEVAACSHQLYPYTDNYASDCYLGLLHYKFVTGFRARAVRARAEGNYWEHSREYVRYLQALEADPRLTLTYPGSRTYTGPAALVAAGLIAPIPWAEAGQGIAPPYLARRLARRIARRITPGLTRIAAALA